MATSHSSVETESTHSGSSDVQMMTKHLCLPGYSSPQVLVCRCVQIHMGDVTSYNPRYDYFPGIIRWNRILGSGYRKQKVVMNTRLGDHIQLPGVLFRSMIILLQ